MKSRFGITLIALLGFFGATAVADNIVPNGNFDGGAYTCTPLMFEGSSICAGSVPSGATEIGAETSIPNGWINDPMDDPEQSDVSIESIPGVGQGGNANYVGFMGSGALTQAGDPNNQGDQDCLYTSFSTVVGQQYTVSFWVEITGSIASNTSLLPVWAWDQAGQENMTESDYFTPTTTFAWEEYQFTETGPAAGYVNLMFHGSDADGAILIDKVSVTEASTAPEPSSLFLISSGIAIFALYRRRPNKNR